MAVVVGDVLRILCDRPWYSGFYKDDIVIVVSVDNAAACSVRRLDARQDQEIWAVSSGKNWEGQVEWMYSTVAPEILPTLPPYQDTT
jgi:hypothetical protein